MNNRVCFINLKKDKNGLFIAKSSSISALFRCWLSKYNIESMEYIDKNLLSLVDTADDILSIIDDTIIFFGDSENIELLKSLIKQILVMEPDIKIALILNENIELLEDISDVIIINDNYEENILKFIDENEEVEILLSDADVTPYKDGFSNINKEEDIEVLIGLNVLGDIIERNYEAIMTEIEYIIENHDLIEKHINLSGISISNHRYKEYILSKILNFKVKFNLIIDAKEFEKNDYDNIFWKIVLQNEDDLKKIVNIKNSTNISSIICNIPISKMSEEFLNSLLKYSNSFKCDIVFINNDKYWTSFEKTKFNDLLLNKKLDILNTFSYGYVFSCTGEYVTVPLNGYSKHIKIDSKDIDENILRRLNEFCSINSSICIKKSEENNSDKEKLYHLNSSNEIYKYNSQIENLKNKMKEIGTIPMRIILKDSTGNISIDSMVNSESLKIQDITYKEIKEMKSFSNNIMYIIYLKTEEDYKLLLEDIEIYKENKSLKNSPLIHGKLYNTCRFLSRNYCNLTKLPRLTIEDSGEIYPCGDCEKSIGNILKDDYYDVVQNAYICNENNFTDKNCAKCKSAILCAKCSLLPSFIKDSYCDVMINKPYISDFIIESAIVKEIMITSSLYNEASIEDIAISNEYFQYYINDIEKGNELPYLSKYVFIAIYKNNHVIWCPNNGKIYRISKEIAIVTEALLKCLPLQDIPKVVSERLNISLEKAQQLCDITYEKFFDTNILYRNIIK